MRNSVDVLVIGAGIVGASAARALAAAGRRVLVLRRGSGIGEASPAAAGMLAAQIEAHDDVIMPLALAARDRHAALAAELADAGHDVGHESEGIYQIALDDSQAAALEATSARQRAAGLDAEWIAAADLPARIAGLGPHTRGALRAGGDGRVNNVALGNALMRDAVKKGAMVEFASADSLHIQDGRVTGLRTSAGDRVAPVVLIAAGAWSPKLAGLPRPLPIEPVRGQMQRAAWPDGLARQVLFGPDAYIVPRGPDAVIGSTMEHSGFDARTTTDGQASIRAAAVRLAPALESSPTIESWAGLRPMTPDQRPILGADPELSGLMYATGHGRNGVLLGPLTGELVAEIILRGESSFDLSPYGIERFSHTPLPTPHDP